MFAGCDENGECDIRNARFWPFLTFLEVISACFFFPKRNPNWQNPKFA
jgi:hypothetical protein